MLIMAYEMNSLLL